VTQRPARTYDLVLPSERSSIGAVAPFLDSIDVLKILGADRYHNMLVAVTEAVNNAIIHGNGCDPSKDVLLQVNITVDELVLVVCDQGQGFDPEAIPDPRSPERLLADGGRGVFLIRQLADSAEFHPSTTGTTVLVKFHIV
jgi:serine/threonine-protein kinase RsbW